MNEQSGVHFYTNTHTPTRRVSANCYSGSKFHHELVLRKGLDRIVIIQASPPLLRCYGSSFANLTSAHLCETFDFETYFGLRIVDKKLFLLAHISTEGSGGRVFV